MTVTGTSKSRLREFRKYAVTDNFNDQYFFGGNWNTNGVSSNESDSEAGRYVYYINAVRYVDNVIGTATTTTFSFPTSKMSNSLNFEDIAYYKNPGAENAINYPKINNDLFIDRQELSAFEKNYQFEFISNLIDIESFAGNNYFNIIKNT